MLGEINHQSPKFNGNPLKFGKAQVISTNTSQDMWLLIQGSSQVNPFWEKVPRI